MENRSDLSAPSGGQVQVETAPKADLPLERIVKEQRWQQSAAEVNRITDRLGMPIDEGIKETVVALNVLGINTVASCEGHFDRGTGAPWVAIGARGVEEVERQAAEAFALSYSKWAQHAPRSEERGVGKECRS